MKSPISSLAVFVSSHGFGHAARAAAVMAALRQRQPALSFELFTTVPEWFFAESVAGPVRHHPVVTDVGMVQTTSLTEDARATAARLDEVFPPPRELVNHLAKQVRDSHCGGILCDISPLGILVAQRAGVPSILVESFTWDFIYGAYVEECPGLERHIDWLHQVVATVDLRIQCEPPCRSLPEAVRVAPIARAPQHPAAATRRRLGVPAGVPLVLVTMGGIPWRHRWLDRMAAHRRCFFVVPGSSERPHLEGRLLTLPHRSGLYHPDLVAAADVVVAKLGYSTVAEVHGADAHLIFVPRSRFPESPVLGGWAERTLSAARLTEERFESGDWLLDLESTPQQWAPARRPPSTGAEQAAAHIVPVLR